MEHLEKMRSREKVLQEKLVKSEDIRSSESQLRRTFNEIKSENESLKQELLNLEVEASQKEERHKIQVTCCVCFPSRSLGVCVYVMWVILENLLKAVTQCQHICL